MSDNPSSSKKSDDDQPRKEQSRGRNLAPIRTSPADTSSVERAKTPNELLPIDPEQGPAGAAEDVSMASPAPADQTLSFETILRDFIKRQESVDKDEVEHYKRAEDFQTLGEEQIKLSAHPSYQQTYAAKNESLCRYKDVKPYDYNRITFDNHPSGTDAYINASLIRLNGVKRKYIAAMAPIPSVFNDWWRMIDERNIGIIVTLCKLVELNVPKCDRYWPCKVGENEVVGEYEITLKEERKFEKDEDYLLRVMELVNKKTGKVQTVHQFHYREWPDHGCPKGEEQVLGMLEQVDAVHLELGADPPPILIHCSAGIGRTGTIIAVDAIREMIQSEELKKPIDIYSVAVGLRQKRAHMVQSLEQYQCVHRCIACYCRQYLEKLLTRQSPAPAPPVVDPPASESADQPSSSSKPRQAAAADPSDNTAAEESAGTSAQEQPEQSTAPS